MYGHRWFFMSIFMIFNFLIQSMLIISRSIVLFFDSHILQSLYLNHTWYKNRVNKENELLLTALNSSDIDLARKHLCSFLKIRSNRRKKAYRKLHTDITKAEQTYEMTEGSARYIEAKLYESIPVYQADSSWLYTADKNYYYATGNNIMGVG